MWGTAARQDDRVRLTQGTQRTVSQTVDGKSLTPDVTGMGARDAVFLLESNGLRVKVKGRGRVVHQSCPPGQPIKEGTECLLTLE